MPHPSEVGQKEAFDAVGKTRIEQFPSNARLQGLLRAHADLHRQNAQIVDRLADELRGLSPNSAAVLADMLGKAI